jgi:hypothetical protein
LLPGLIEGKPRGCNTPPDVSGMWIWLTHAEEKPHACHTPPDVSGTGATQLGHNAIGCAGPPDVLAIPKKERILSRIGLRPSQRVYRNNFNIAPERVKSEEF